MPKFNVEVNIDKDAFSELILNVYDEIDDEIDIFCIENKELDDEINKLIETDFIPKFKEEANYLLERLIKLAFERHSELTDDYDSEEIIDYVDDIIDSTNIERSITNLIEERETETE